MILLHIIRKQPFTDFPENDRFKKIRNIYRKMPVLESLFNKLADLNPAT